MTWNDLECIFHTKVRFQLARLSRAPNSPLCVSYRLSLLTEFRELYCSDNRRYDRLVYTLQAIVAATIAPTVAATIAPCIRPVIRRKLCTEFTGVFMLLILHGNIRM